MTALPLSGSFAQVDPTHVAAVGPAAAILFARIAWRCQDGRPWRATRTDLAAETGLSPAMIRTAAEVLREREWVTTERTSALDATLLWRPVLAGQPENAESASRDSGSRTTPPAESAISSLETVNTTTPPPPTGDGLFPVTEAVREKPTPLRSVPTDDETAAEFDRFWSLYPRRTGKKAALAAYRKARREATVQQIAHGLRAQLPAMQQRIAAGEAQYVPHPTTWLNQGRWEDHVQQDAPGAPAGGEAPLQRYRTPDGGYVLLPPPRTNPFAR